MTLPFFWVPLIFLIVINAIMIYDTYFINYSKNTYFAHETKIALTIFLIVFTAIAWIYATSRILYNYFTKGKPISFN